MAYKKIVPLMFVLGTIFNVNAKITDRFDIFVQPKNAQGDFVEMITSLGGWSCSSSASTTFTSVQKDEKGNEKRISRERKHDYRFSTTWQGNPSVHMNFEYNNLNISPALRIYVKDTCEKTEYVWKTVVVTDADGNTTTELQQVAETSTVYNSWSCDLDQRLIPRGQGQVNAGVCHSYRSSYSDWDLDSLMLSSLRDKEIHYAIRHNGSYESFIEMNKRSSVVGESDEYIFNISQGLGGRGLEDDFKIIVTVNGIEKVLQTNSGLINEDFRIYVPKGTSSINLKFQGVEEDLIADDAYGAYSEINLFKNSKSDRIVSLTRKGLLGESDHSMIRVKLVRGPKVEASQPKSLQLLERLRANVDKKVYTVSAQLENINNIKKELARAESNFNTAKMISIPVSITGAGLVAFGSYNMYVGDGIETKDLIMAGTGAAMLAGAGTAIMLTQDQVNKVLAKLKNVEQTFQTALEDLEARKLELEQKQMAIMPNR